MSVKILEIKRENCPATRAEKMGFQFLVLKDWIYDLLDHIRL